MAVCRFLHLALFPSLLHQVSPFLFSLKFRTLPKVRQNRLKQAVSSTRTMSTTALGGTANGDGSEVGGTSEISTVPKIPSFSQNVERTLDPCVVLMKQLVGQYADLWKDKGGIYSLAQGIVYWKPPKEATVAMKEALDDPDSNLHLYGPDEGLLELRTKLADKVATENGLRDHQIMVTVGANQAYVNCVLTLMQETDKCVVFAPYYFNHVMALQMTFPQSCMIVGPCSTTGSGNTVESKEQTGQGKYQEGTPDIDWLEQALRNDSSIRVVTVVNPGNPTGTNLSREILQKTMDLCKQYNAWLVLDCTYEYFVPDSNFDGCFSDSHVLHIFSFSKAYALAGYRCGYLAIPNAAVGLYDQMMKVQDTIPITPPRISQVAALASLSVGKEWVKSHIATLDTGRAAILEALQPLEKIIGGSGAMYAMGKLPISSSPGDDLINDDKEFARLLVKEFGVAVIPGSFCGFPGWIRVCYANLPPEQCVQAAKRLSSGLAALVGHAPKQN